MANTTFRNASGLPDPGQTTTARDMATLALRLQDDFPLHYPLFSLRSFTYKGDRHRNHNTLLFSYQGTDGIKTGYTRASGFNLVANVRREGRHVVGVIFGGSSAASRNAQLRTLLTRALAKATTTKTRKAPVLAARPQPAPRPRPKAVAAVAPSPAVAATSAGPPEAKVRVAGLDPDKFQTSSPGAATDSAPAPAPAPVAIDIARVRPVLLAPRALADRAGTGGATVAGSAEGAASAATPALSRAAAGPAATSAESMQPKTAAATGGGRTPTNVEELLSSLSGKVAAKPETSAAPAAAQAKDVPRPVPAVAVADASRFALGARPSSLQEQAANLARGLPPTGEAPTSPVVVARAEPAPSPVIPAKAVYRIQVGAFATGAEAEGRLALVRQRASELVVARPSEVQPVQKGARQFYRARFSGFDASSASAACAALKRRQIECLVTNAD
jgi:D-alanyl-D-alanine carboxypeptidase